MLGNLPKQAATRATEVAKRLNLSRPAVRLSRPTWPVGADLLFERVRSVEYMVLATSLTLLIWMWQLILTSRVHLGNTKWEWDTEFNLKPLYWLAYADCGTADADTSMKSAFGVKPCNSSVQSGFVWEILYAAMQNLLDMVLLQMVNNPWRSKLWGLPAFAIIAFNILDWGKLIFYGEDGDDFDGQLDVLVTAQRIQYGMFASLWTILLLLLFHVLWSANFNKQRGHESVEYTRRLLRSKANTDAPSRFQKYAEALKPVCDQEDLPHCAQAALRHKELREEARRAESEASDESRQGLRGWFDRMLSRCRSSPDRATGSVAQSAVEADGAETPPVKPVAKKVKAAKGLRSLDRLPSLAQISLLLSALMVIFAGVLIIYLATASKLIFTTGGMAIDSTAGSALQLAEAMVTLTQTTQNLTGQVVAMGSASATVLPNVTSQLFASFSQGQQAVAQLDALASQLEAAGNADAAATLRTQVATLRAIPLFDFDNLQPLVEALAGVSGVFAFVDAIGQQLEGLGQLAQSLLDQVRTMNEYVRFAVDWANKLGTSSEATLLISTCISLPVAFAIIETRRSWRKMRDEVKVGGHRQSPYWEPVLFDPVKAPTLPGLMASSVLLAFISVVLMLFVVMEAIVMALYSGLTIPWETIGSMALGSGSMVLVKVFVLDKLARHFLTRDGFVTAWVGFAWFVCFTLPFYALTSILAAIYRFIVLVGVGFCYVAAVHTTLLPPKLQAFDPGWTASMAMMLMAHRHNSPINFSFSEAFLGDGVGRDISKTRAQKNWKMAITMVRNPKLADLRVFPEDDANACTFDVDDAFTNARSPCSGSPKSQPVAQPQSNLVESAGLREAREEMQ